jgi:hypothetical protein
VTKRKRKPSDDPGAERLERAVSRWRTRYQQETTAPGRLVAAYDWLRAAGRLSTELTGDSYMNDLATGWAADDLEAQAVVLCQKIGEML